MLRVHGIGLRDRNAAASRFPEERFLVRHLCRAWLAGGVLLAVGCGKIAPVGVSVDKAFKPYLSPDAKALVSLNIDKLKASDLYKQHRQAFNIAQLDVLSDRTGLDVRRDLVSILVVWDGKRPLLLARGVFSPEEVEQKLTGFGARPAMYKGYKLFQGDSDVAGFPDRSSAIAGPRESVQAALDLKTAGEGTVPDELLERMKTIPKDSQIWEVSRGGLPFIEVQMRSELRSALDNISDFVSGTTLGISFDSGSHLRADIICVSNPGAERVHDALRGLMGLGRLSTDSSNLDLLRMWDSIDVNQDQRIVHVKADLPADLTEKAFEMLPGIARRAGDALNSR